VFPPDSGVAPLLSWVRPGTISPCIYIGLVHSTVHLAASFGERDSAKFVHHITKRCISNRPISVYRLVEMSIQSCGQSVSAPRVKAGARLNAHTELRAKHQRSARSAIYRNPKIRNRPIICTGPYRWDCTEDALMAQLAARDPLGLGLPSVWALRLIRRLLSWDPTDRPTAGAYTRSLLSST
jgi:hypothetical protein